MNQNQKTWTGIACAAVLLLYFTGFLWPLVRFALTVMAISGLVTSAYLAFRYYRANKNVSGEQAVEKPQARQAVSAALATAMTFLLLSLVPGNPTVATPDSAPAQSVVVVPEKPARRASSPAPVTVDANKRTPNLPKNVAKRTTRSSPAPVAKTKSRPAAQTTRSSSATRSQQSKGKMSADEADKAVAEFMGALIGAAAEQQKRQQTRDRNDPRMRYAGEGGNVCIQCDGAKFYRYVDANGALQVKTCPRCNGSGKAF